MGALETWIILFFFLGYGGHLAVDRGRIFSLKHCLPEAFSTQKKRLWGRQSSLWGKIWKVKPMNVKEVQGLDLRGSEVC